MVKIGARYLECAFGIRVVMATPNAGQFPTPTLYVGNLKSDVNEVILFEMFNAVGSVASIRVCRDVLSGQSLGYAYVNYHTFQDAEYALAQMNFVSIAGQACRIMWAQRNPSLRKTGEGNIFVKGLPEEVDNRGFLELFSVFGKILSCKISQSSDGKSLGYGFVHFDTAASAKLAIEKADGMLVADSKISVKPFIPRTNRVTAADTFTNVYVKNLPVDVEEDAVLELFSTLGEITSSMIAKNREGESRGFAFINYADHSSAAMAVEKLSGVTFQDRELVVTRAMKKEERSKILKDKFERSNAEKQKKWASCNVYVKNLSDDIDGDSLKAMFIDFGPITSVRVMADDSGNSRGFGFVCFEQSESARAAIDDMNGKLIDDKPLFVALAQKKEARSQQRYTPIQTRAPVLSHPAVIPHPGMVAPVLKTESMEGELTLETLQALAPGAQKQALGEILYPLVMATDSVRAGKITGMLLEMENSELLELLGSQSMLKSQIGEAITVLDAAQY